MKSVIFYPLFWDDIKQAVVRFVNVAPNFVFLPIWSSHGKFTETCFHDFPVIIASRKLVLVLSSIFIFNLLCLVIKL